MHSLSFLLNTFFGYRPLQTLSVLLLGIMFTSLLGPVPLLAQLPNSGVTPPGGGGGGGGGGGTGPLFQLQHFVPGAITPGNNSVQISYQILVQYDHAFQPYVQVLGGGGSVEVYQLVKNVDLTPGPGPAHQNCAVFNASNR